MKSFLAKFICLFYTLANFASFGQAEESSLINTNSESSEVTAIVALEKLLAENHRLKIEAEDVKSSAANATKEAEVFRRQLKALSERMEILGGNATEPSKLEQRLLQAVHDLQLSDKFRKELTDEIIRLAQCASEFIKKPDAEAKTVLEVELHKVDDILIKTLVSDFPELAVKATQTAPDLMNAKVSAVKPELTCVVINAGAKQGVKVGSPFQVHRKNKLIGTIRVVDVRQAFAGSVIQNLVSDKDPIQLGDTIKVDAQPN